MMKEEHTMKNTAPRLLSDDELDLVIGGVTLPNSLGSESCPHGQPDTMGYNGVSAPECPTPAKKGTYTGRRSGCAYCRCK